MGVFGRFGSGAACDKDGEEVCNDKGACVRWILSFLIGESALETPLPSPADSTGGSQKQKSAKIASKFAEFPVENGRILQFRHRCWAWNREWLRSSLDWNTRAPFQREPIAKLLYTTALR